MPTPRNHPAAGAVSGKVYVIGGRLAAPNIGGFVSSNTDVVEEYDPATNTWRALNKMPTPRHGVNLAGYGNRLHAIGGHIAFAATGGTALHTPAHEVFEFTR